MNHRSVELRFDMFDTIKDWWGAIVTSGTVVAGLAVGRHRLRQVEKDLEDQKKTAKEQETASKRRLYDEDGQPIYVMQKECIRMTNDCRHEQREEIKELKALIVESNNKQEARYSEIQAALRGLAAKR